MTQPEDRQLAAHQVRQPQSSRTDRETNRGKNEPPEPSSPLLVNSPLPTDDNVHPG